RRQSRYVDAMCGDQLASALGVRRIEPKGNSVPRQRLAQLMAARRPLLAHDAQHLVMGTVEPGPRAERLLDSKVKPFLWREASLHDPEVDPVERGGVAQGRERIERDAG